MGVEAEALSPQLPPHHAPPHRCQPQMLMLNAPFWGCLALLCLPEAGVS